MKALFREIDQFILDRMSEGRLPGLSLAIVKDGEVIYARGYGFRDVESAEPASESTLYCIGSITKSFTALSIMKLVEMGLVSVDDPVDKYLDNIPVVFKRGVTLHHLLTHSSGLPALGYAEAYIRGLAGVGDSWLPINRPVDVMEFMDGAEDWVESKPGERFFYLNEGYVALGLVIEKVSGLSYEEFVKKHILDPLGMNRTYLDPSDIHRDGGMAKPYVVSDEGFRETGFPFGIYSDGGIVSNVLDLANYIRMFMNEGEFNGVRIIRRDLIDAMEKPYINLPYEIFGGESYGYGLMITPDFFGYKLVGHSGSVLVHTGYIGFIRDAGIGVVLLANGSGYRLSFIGQFILAKLLDVNPWDMPFLKNERVLNSLVGDYEMYRGTVRAKVVKNGSMLYLRIREASGWVEYPLYPEVLGEEHSIFKTINNWREYRVEFKKKGSSIEFIYERYKFRRV